MMRLYLLLILLVMPFASALKISPNTLDIAVVKGTPKNYTVTVIYDNTTPFNFTIYNITFSSVQYLKYKPIPNLSYNESKDIVITAFTDSVFNTKYLPKLQFFYLTNTTLQPVNRTVQVTNTGFSPVMQNAVNNDTLVFENIDTVNHTVSILGQPTLYNVPVNKTWSYRVEKGNYTFVDETTSTGIIVVVTWNNILQPTVNPSWYLNYDIDLVSENEKAVLQTELTKPISPMDYDAQSTGVIIMRSSQEIFNISLNSDSWIKFSKNYFDLDGDDAVIFTVHPDNITKTEETDKVYTKVITIKGNNIDAKNISFDIEITYANLTLIALQNQSIRFVERPWTGQETKEYCEQTYGTIDQWEGWCAELRQNNSIYIYQNRTLNPELSEKTVIDYLDQQSREDEDTATVKTKVENLDTTISNNSKELQIQVENQTREIQELKGKLETIYEFVNGIRSEKTTTGWVMVLGGIIVLGVITILLVYRAKRKKNIQGHSSI